jgi:hypothetical protein
LVAALHRTGGGRDGWPGGAKEREIAGAASGLHACRAEEENGKGGSRPLSDGTEGRRSRARAAGACREGWWNKRGVEGEWREFMLNRGSHAAEQAWWEKG